MRPLLVLAAAAATTALMTGCGGSSTTSTQATVPTTRLGTTSVRPCGPFKGRNASDVTIRTHNVDCAEARTVILAYVSRRAAPAGWHCAPTTLTARSTSGGCQSDDGQKAATATWRLTSATE